MAYCVKKQVWLPTHIEQTTYFCPDAKRAVKRYLDCLHQSDTTCVLFQNMETGCACWPENQTVCEHTKGEFNHAI